MSPGSMFKKGKNKADPTTFKNPNQEVFYTSRRLRKDLGPIKGSHYIDLSYEQMMRALIMPKHWMNLEVQSSIEFLLGSILFTLGSIDELHSQSLFKTFFMIGSILFLIGGATQLWQAIRAWRRHKNYILVSFSLAMIGLVAAKAGTLFFNADSLSSWLNLNMSSETKQILEPDAYLVGSILFLISGIAHYAEIGHGRLLFIETHHLGWWSCTSFLLGSLLYCLSALHGFETVVVGTINLTSEKNSILLCLSASSIFILMSLCSLAECSENEIKQEGTF